MMARIITNGTVHCAASRQQHTHEGHVSPSSTRSSFIPDAAFWRTENCCSAVPLCSLERGSPVNSKYSFFCTYGTLTFCKHVAHTMWSKADRTAVDLTTLDVMQLFPTPPTVRVGIAWRKRNSINGCREGHRYNVTYFLGRECRESCWIEHRQVVR